MNDTVAGFELRIVTVVLSFEELGALICDTAETFVTCIESFNVLLAMILNRQYGSILKIARLLVR